MKSECFLQASARIDRNLKDTTTSRQLNNYKSLAQISSDVIKNNGTIQQHPLGF